MVFFLLLRDESDANEDFDTPWAALLYIFNMMFGDFDIRTFKHAPRSPAIAILLFVTFMLVIPTVMLNALIAIMVRM